MVSKNPFFPSQPVPPECFVGRTSEVATAFDQILSRSHLAVWGGRGMGKLSFLELLACPQVWQLHGHDPSKAVIVYLNCLDINPFLPSRFWGKLLSVLKDKLENNTSLISEIDSVVQKTEATKDDLRLVLKHIGEQGKFLLLLLDDYHVTLHPNPQYTEIDIEVFLSECRSLAYHAQERKYLSIVVTSFRRLNDIGPRLTPDKSPWFNHYLFLPLKPFDNIEVATLLAGMPMSLALRDGIKEIAGGNPSLLQNAGYLVYTKLRDKQIINPEKLAKEFLERTEQIFQDIWDLSNEMEQTLLMLIALSRLKGRLNNERYDLGDVSIIFSQKERELTDLEQAGVIVTTLQQGKTTYSFASSTMEWWVIKEIENCNEEKLQQRQKVFLGLMSRKQVDKVTSVIKYLWQHKDELPSVIEWMSKLTTALPKGFLS